MNARVELITQAAYARRRGVAKSAVAKAVNEGRISLIDGKVDPAVADIQWAQNTRARADSGRAGALATVGEGGTTLATENASAGPGAADTTPKDDYHYLRTERERVALDREKRENDEAAGRLVDRKAVERGVFDTFRALRDDVMARPPRAAAKVIGMADAREIERVITDELRAAFESAEARLLSRIPGKETP